MKRLELPAAESRLRFLNRDALKYIALLFMFAGHFIGYTMKYIHAFGMPKKCLWWVLRMQYFAPPVFMFFIAEGFHYTRSAPKYALRLGVLTFVTQFAYVLCHKQCLDWQVFFTEWNVIATMLCGLLVLMLWESKLKLWQKVPLLLLCAGASWFTEWQITGVLEILVLHLLREKPLLRLGVFSGIMYVFLAVSSGTVFLGFSGLCTFGIFVLPILLVTFFYNGKKGRFPVFSKYLFYVFYPAHLLLIFLVKICSQT